MRRAAEQNKEKCNGLLDRHNKQINRVNLEKQELIQEKDKLAKEVVALNTKVQDVEAAREVVDKAAEETIT